MHAAALYLSPGQRPKAARKRPQRRREFQLLDCATCTPEYIGIICSLNISMISEFCLKLTPWQCLVAISNNTLTALVETQTVRV